MLTLTEVNGRDPAAEDGAVANVLPYLRLALAAGKGPEPLALRWRRGEGMPLEKNVPSAVRMMHPRLFILLRWRIEGRTEGWIDNGFSWLSLPQVVYIV